MSNATRLSNNELSYRLRLVDEPVICFSEKNQIRFLAVLRTEKYHGGRRHITIMMKLSSFTVSLYEFTNKTHQKL